MKTFLFFLCLIMGFHLNFAQDTILQKTLESEVNQEIWKPFKKSYEARDWETFNSLHTDDILRVHDRGIQKGQEYKDNIRSSYGKESSRKATIDFVMERRTYAKDVGYEVGFYRVIYKESGKEDRMSYGRFHVVLKKIEGVWKIAQDWDSSYFNDRPIGIEDFTSALILKLTD